MRNKILQILKENVFELLNKDIGENTKLISTGYLESFDVINLITLFEKEFNIDIKLEEIELSSFETVIAMEELLNIMLNDKKIIIKKSSKDEIDLCVISLFNTEFGKTYYPSLDFLKNILYKAMEKDFVYIAKYNEKIIGFIWFSKCNMFGEFPYLNLIFVFEKFRGIGIGTELLHFFETKVIEICKKPKLKLFLVVKDENHNAISFYERNKYHSIGIIKGLFRASINEILMMKEINYKF